MYALQDLEGTYDGISITSFGLTYGIRSSVTSLLDKPLAIGVKSVN